MLLLPDLALCTECIFCVQSKDKINVVIDGRLAAF